MPPPTIGSFNSLGVKLSKPEDDESVEKLALVMFDTRNIKVRGQAYACPPDPRLSILTIPRPEGSV